MIYFTAENGDLNVSWRLFLNVSPNCLRLSALLLRLLLVYGRIRCLFLFYLNLIVLVARVFVCIHANYQLLLLLLGCLIYILWLNGLLFLFIFQFCWYLLCIIVLINWFLNRNGIVFGNVTNTKLIWLHWFNGCLRIDLIAVYFLNCLDIDHILSGLYHTRYV